jgi:hypothetical protein
MHKMPVARVPVPARILAHGRNKYAIRKRNISNRQRIKQVTHKLYAAFRKYFFDAASEVVCAFFFISMNGLRAVPAVGSQIMQKQGRRRPSPACWLRPAESEYQKETQDAHINYLSAHLLLFTSCNDSLVCAKLDSRVTVPRKTDVA